MFHHNCGVHSYVGRSTQGCKCVCVEPAIVSLSAGGKALVDRLWPLCSQCVCVCLCVQNDDGGRLRQGQVVSPPLPPRHTAQPLGLYIAETPLPRRIRTGTLGREKKQKRI